MTGPARRRRRPSGGRQQRGSKSSTPTWTPPWRKGLPERPTEDPVAPGTGSPLPLGSVLEGLLGSKGPWVAGMAAGELGRRWGDVVGTPLDRETAPGTLDGRGVLTVRAASPAWATQLRFLSVRIAANANEILGRPAVTEVRVVVDRALGTDAPGTDRRSISNPYEPSPGGPQDAGSAH
jgi:predicted nucleic acid-binding Zn ribbon protein